jgi:acyl dehydratase
MPIHADPKIARDAGFERPISHGLNTFGLVCRAALKLFVPGRPERLKSMSVRFAAPAYPGDTIRIELFARAQGARFRARVLERKALILDRGEIELW